MILSSKIKEVDHVAALADGEEVPVIHLVEEHAERKELVASCGDAIVVALQEILFHIQG